MPALLTAALVVLSSLGAPASAGVGDAWKVPPARCVVPDRLDQVAVHVPATEGEGSVCSTETAGVGGTWYPVAEGTEEAVVTASLAPEGGAPVVADYVVLDGEAVVLEAGTFCGTTRRSLPAQARSLWVLPRPATCGTAVEPAGGPTWVSAALRGGDGGTTVEAGTAEGCVRVLAVGEPAPGDTASEHEGCRSQRRDVDGEHCVESARTVCLIVDVDRPAEIVDVSYSPGCGPPGPTIHVTLLGNTTTACVGVVADVVPDPPTPSVTPPSVGTEGVIPEGETSVGPCASSFGGTVKVLGNGATVCVTADAGTGGEDLNVDLTPCPSGVDPRVDVLGVWVSICLRATLFLNPPGEPDVDPGGVQLPEEGELMPDVSLVDCPGGRDPSVWWLGAGAEVCVVLDPGLPVRASGCEEGAGAVVQAGGSKGGACVS